MLEIAQALVNIGAVGLSLQTPITFKSGIRSPIYTDNRRLPFHPTEWRKVIAGFQQLIVDNAIQFDVIAGIEAAGIPHSAALGYAMQQSSVFVRKQAKAHGQKKLVEGGDVAGKRVLLIEDLVTTGGSSLAGVQALREAGAVVEDCLVITSYGFVEAVENFEHAKIKLHVLTPFETIWQVLQANLNATEIAIVNDWWHDPHGWAIRQGLG